MINIQNIGGYGCIDYYTHDLKINNDVYLHFELHKSLRDSFIIIKFKTFYDINMSSKINLISLFECFYYNINTYFSIINSNDKILISKNNGMIYIDDKQNEEIILDKDETKQLFEYILYMNIYPLHIIRMYKLDSVLKLVEN